MPSSLRLRLAVAAGALAAGLAAAPSAGASALDTRVSAASAADRSCIAGPASGASVVRRTVTAPATGQLSARLAGSGTGDWDLAVFGAAKRLVAGGASFGLSEVAGGIVAKGEELTVQACRRSGNTRSVRLIVDVLPVDVPTNPEPIQLVRVSLPTPAARDALDATGVDQTEHTRDGLQDVLLHDSADAAKLRRAGLSYEVIVPDVVKAGRQARAAAAPGDGTSVPSGRTDYRRLPDYQEDMKRLVRENPTLVKPITLPNKTLEGRAVEGIEITRNVDAQDGKPVFFQMGVHHAREWPSGEHAIEWAFEMVNGMKREDPRVTALLDKARIIVVPIVNVDGFNLSRESQPDVNVGPIGLVLEAYANTGFAYKRRNCRIQDLATPAPGVCGAKENRTKGVDNNRNYGGFWGGPGASNSTTNDTYRGAAPFSEPETQNVRAVVSSRQVTTLITNHTYSDLVLRPPGLRAQGDPPDEPVYKALGDAMAKENGYSSEKSWELYDTTGTTEDWSYYATGGLGFTFEIGKAADGPTGLETLAGVGFHPPYPIGVTNEWYGKYPGGGGNREAYYKALEATADTKLHSVIAGKAPAGAKIRLTKSFDTKTSEVIQPSGPPKPAISFRDELNTVMAVPDSGRFEFHANPSTRPITVKGEPGRPAQGPTAANQTFTGKGNTVSFPAEQNANLSPPGSHEDIPFEITPDQDNAKLTVVVSWADKADDYDLYLMKENGPVDTQVASGAQGGGTTNTEQIVFKGEEGKPIAPGQYFVRMVDYSVAKKGFTGSITFQGPDAFRTPAPRSEAWTVSCELDGASVARRDVIVDRGERVDVGEVCPPDAAQILASRRVCAGASGFARTSVKPTKGRRGLQFGFRRFVARPVTVDVFQSSSGRRIFGERRVARFTGRTRAFTWDGKATAGNKAVRDGVFFARFRIKGIKRADFRRATLVRRNGRFSVRRTFYRPNSCGLLASAKLERPAFGGRTNRPLRVAFRVARMSTVRVTVLRGKRVARTIQSANRRGRRTHRLRIPSEGLRAKGLYRVVITAVSRGKRVRTTLLAQRL